MMGGLFPEDDVANGDFRVQPCLSPVWDTAITLTALGAAGVKPDSPAMQKGADWLLSKEVKMRGDWVVKNPTKVIGGEVIQVSEPKPRRIPSKKWRELIKKVWEADPLLCPHCQHDMRIVALIDDEAVIERILRHLGLWEAGVRVESARDPPAPAEPVIEPWLDDPFPNYDHEPVFAQN